jgi:cellulose 1,4-beta-cellobiosidase
MTATAVSSTRVDLSWAASTDNIGVAGYTVRRDGAVVATVSSGTTYSDTKAAPGTTYQYSVTAFDAAGNTSAARLAAPVTTPTAAGSAIAFVRDAIGGTTGGTSFTVPIVSTAGDALVASVAIQAGSTAAVSGIADSAGGTWTRGPVGFLSGASTRIELWYRTAGAPVTSATVTLNTAKAASANVAEFTGIATTAALDASAATSTATSTIAALPALTTTNANDLVVGAVNYPGTATSTLNATGFSALSSFTTSTVNGRAAYRIVAVPGTWAGAWTLSAAANSGGVAIALKGA